MPRPGGAEGKSLDRDAIRDQYARLVENQFTYMWRRSQPREKLVLLALALGDFGIRYLAGGLGTPAGFIVATWADNKDRE